VTAGRIGADEAGRLRDLLGGTGNLLVAAPTARSRRLVVRTLLAEAAAFGQRILHVQETERFHIPAADFVALAWTPASRRGIEALAARMRPDLLVFAAPTVATQPWLLDWTADRRFPVLVTVQARSPGDLPGRLARYPGGRREAGTATIPADVVDAAVFVASPGAPWSIQLLADRTGWRGSPGSES
jgi:hypothetical protein